MENYNAYALSFYQKECTDIIIRYEHEIEDNFTNHVKANLIQNLVGRPFYLKEVHEELLETVGRYDGEEEDNMKFIRADIMILRQLLWASTTETIEEIEDVHDLISIHEKLTHIISMVQSGKKFSIFK